MSDTRWLMKQHPAALILSSFLLAILAGTLLLKLPVSVQTDPLSWIDTFFTATSAVCVTGLIVVDTGTVFSRFGQVVILVLIQIGGLGVMTLSVLLFKMAGRKMFFHQRMAVQDMLIHTPQVDILKVVKNIVLITLCVETVGAVLLTLFWCRTLPLHQAAYTAVFHSISAFCNAGFSLFSDSLVSGGNSFLLNATVASLIVIGGIGFSVLYELQNWLKLRKKKRFKFTLQLKTVLVTTGILITAGAVGFAVLEHQGTLAGKSFGSQILISVFQSITCRTAGFNTVDISALNEATLFMMIFLMFFGASPGSCGGGVKTTTLAIMTASIISRVRRMQRINLFKKSIPEESISRSTTLVLISMGIISLVLFLMLAQETISNHRLSGSFIAHLFEVVSAFGTVGLSMGITSELSFWGKLWIIITMIIGRVGILTFSYVIVGKSPTRGYERAEENMMIG